MLLRATPEDFVVEEVPLYPPSGEGEHTFVYVEKRGRTTEEIARALGRLADVKARDIGYAGRKDRVAVTRQWFSVPGLDPARALAHEEESFRVLEARRHGHKLRTGQLRANRFELIVRELEPDVMAAAPGRLERLVSEGMPNRFGEQRFGREGDNAARGRELLAGAPLGRDRRAARFILSALQSEIFNAWLDARRLGFDELEEGEIAWIHESGACFVVEDAALESERAARFELSPAGPLPGTRLLEAVGAPGDRERALFEAHGIPDPIVPPRGVRLRGARRPARIRPDAASCEAVAPDALALHFTLPPGSYATVLVNALFTKPEPSA